MAELDARLQPGSGNQPGAKGDGRKKGELRIETKYTKDESYRLQHADLEKIASECGLGEKPVMVIDFVDSGTSKTADRYAVIDFNHFKELHAAHQHR